MIDEGYVIDIVCDHRLKEHEEDSEDDDDTYTLQSLCHRYEFFIKWKNYSYLHNTWENYDFLKDFKGIKKVDNYIKNNIILEKDMYADPNVTQEEIEQRNVNREIERELLKDYETVERIIGTRQHYSDDGAMVTQYFVKWKRLPYQSCTWENFDTISQYQQEIDDFLDRNQSQHIPSKGKSYGKDNRPPFKKMATQPNYFGKLELRDYQLTGLNWMAYLWSRNENGILADEMGLGKTIQTISFLSYLFHTINLYGPFLVVVPLSTIGSWQKELARWAPDMNAIVYTGDGKSREVIRDFEFYVSNDGKSSGKKVKFNALLTTYELILKDRAELSTIKWSFLAVDEAHRLKNTDSQLYEALKEFHTTNRLLITGTPLQNSLKELWALIHFLMPGKYQGIENDYEINYDDVKQDEAKIRQLHEKLRPLMLRRLKKDVEKSLPSKVERILRVELAPLQIHYYKHILARNFAILNKGLTGGAQTSLLNIAAELKKASNHPYLFPGAEPITSNKEEQLRGIVANSGKMVLLEKLLTRLKAGGHRVLIFSQMVRLLDILTDYLVLKGYKFQRLDGSVGSEARKKSVDHFNAPGSTDFVFLLSTRAGGLGLNLETADTVIIFDSDWNPQNDVQAMARAHRIGQKKTVNVYRFLSKGTMEEDILERAKQKMVLEYCVIKQMDTSGSSVLQQQQMMSKPISSSNPFTKEELSAILRFGAMNMFKENENRPKLDDMDLDDILARAEHHETATDQSAADGGEEFLKQFQVTDYEGLESWEDIIPEAERSKIVTEEAQEEELIWPRKRKVVSYDERGNGENRKSAAPAAPVKKRRRATGKTNPNELGDKDVRSLVRAMMKFGASSDRVDDIINEANLQDKDASAVADIMATIISTCKDAMDNPPAEAASTKGKKKPHILVSYGEVSDINAEQLISRVSDLETLASQVNGTKMLSFRLSIPLKPVSWTCRWGQKEDAMLLVGIYKHGNGNWARIRDDKSLNLQEKMFLDAQDNIDAIPKAVHLQRRSEYLLKVLRTEATKAQARHNLKKTASKSSRAKSNTPATPGRPKSRRLQDKEQNKESDLSEQGIGGSDSGDDHDHASEKEKAASDYDSMDEAYCKELLRPCKKQLRCLRDEASQLSGSEKAELIKTCLLEVGSEIDKILSRMGPKDTPTLRRHLWFFVSFFWPITQSSRKIEELYNKIVAKSDHAGTRSRRKRPEK
jgi:chromodomain-helicase-DNA-binding protein 1